MYFSDVQTDMEKYGVEFPGYSSAEYHNWNTELRAWADVFLGPELAESADNSDRLFHWYNLVMAAKFEKFGPSYNIMLMVITDVDSFVAIEEQLMNMDSSDPEYENLMNSYYQLMEFPALDDEVRDGSACSYSGPG